MSRNAKGHQKLEETRGDLPLEPLEGVWLCHHLCFRAQRKFISVVPSYHACGNLSWQLLDVNIISMLLSVLFRKRQCFFAFPIVYLLSLSIFPASYKGLHWLLYSRDWPTVGLQSQVSMVSALSSTVWRRQTYTGTSKYNSCWSCCQYEVPWESRRRNTLFSGYMGVFPEVNASALHLLKMSEMKMRGQ